MDVRENVGDFSKQNKTYINLYVRSSVFTARCEMNQ